MASQGKPQGTPHTHTHPFGAVAKKNTLVVDVFENPIVNTSILVKG